MVLTYQKKTYEPHAAVFKALGHPVRLWIVSQLADEREHCVCEFVDKTTINFSTVSQHLQVLKGSGIVGDDKRGKQVYYKLLRPCILDFVACLKRRS